MHTSNYKIKWNQSIDVKIFDRETRFFLTIFKRLKKKRVYKHAYCIQI